jgi:DNA polymerase-4
MPSSIPQNVAKFRRRWLLLRPCRNDFAKAGTVSIEIRGACSAVVLKLKTSEFSILTRSHTPRTPPSSCEELTSIALSLRERVDLGPQRRYRLVGVGLSNFRAPEVPAHPVLFD